MSEVHISAKEALDTLRSLSPNNYRTDSVFVDCTTTGENAAVDDAADKALRNGFVNKYVTGRKAHNLTVFIEFRKPHWLE